MVNGLERHNLGALRPSGPLYSIPSSNEIPTICLCVEGFPLVNVLLSVAIGAHQHEKSDISCIHRRSMHIGNAPCIPFSHCRTDTYVSSCGISIVSIWSLSELCDYAVRMAIILPQVFLIFDRTNFLTRLFVSDRKRSLCLLALFSIFHSSIS